MKMMTKTRIIKHIDGTYSLWQKSTDGKYKFRARSDTKQGIEQAKAIASKFFPKYTVQ